MRLILNTYNPSELTGFGYAFVDLDTVQKVDEPSGFVSDEAWSQ